MGQQTPSSVAATTLNLQGNVDPSHLQIAGRGNHRRGTPREMLSVPSLHRPKDFRLGRGESGHRPLFPQPSHSLPHLQDVHSLEAEGLGPQRRPLHLHQLRGTIHRVWAPTPQADHSDLPQLQGQEIPPTIAAVSTTLPMVDPETEPGSPRSHVHPASKHHDLDRRLENRVGGYLLWDPRSAASGPTRRASSTSTPWNVWQ